ncbi:MAG: hypothetical protein ACM359_18290 [Bacillota bacterium]
MPVLNRPGSIIRHNGLFGYTSPDPSYGFRGTAFTAYNPRRAMLLAGYDSPEDMSDPMLPYPMPHQPASPNRLADSLLPSMPTSHAPATPQFAHPNVAFNRANDANADVAYLKTLLPSADPVVNAMRARSIAAKSGVANGFTGNAFLNRELITDSNKRSNDVTGATVRGMDAYTTTMLPALSSEVDSRAKLNTSRSNEIDQMLPYQQDAVNANTWGKHIENAGNYSFLPYIPQIAEQQVGAAKLRNERDRKMLPALVKSAEANVDDKAGIIEGWRRLTDAERQFVNQKQVVSTNTNPYSKFDALDQEYELRKKISKENADEWLKTMLPSPRPIPSPSSPTPANGFPQLMGGSTMIGPLGGLMPTPSPAAPTPPMLPTPAPLPTVAQLQGTPIQLRNGQIVYQQKDGSYIDQQGNRFDKQGKHLTADLARQILQETGGDREKARQIARSRGYGF